MKTKSLNQTISTNLKSIKMKSLLIILAILSLTFTSCKKEEKKLYGKYECSQNILMNDDFEGHPVYINTIGINEYGITLTNSTPGGASCDFDKVESDANQFEYFQATFTSIEIYFFGTEGAYGVVEEDQEVLNPNDLKYYFKKDGENLIFEIKSNDATTSYHFTRKD